MPDSASAPAAAPAGRGGLAGTAVADPGSWDGLARAAVPDPGSWDGLAGTAVADTGDWDASGGWNSPPAWDAIPPGWDAIPPTDEELWRLASEFDSGPPDGNDVWAMDANADLSFLPRDDGLGAGFAVSGAADTMPPGVTLAGLASGAWGAGLERLTDDQLIGLLRAWRRLTSWTAAGELAAVAELHRRRVGEVAAGADPHLAEHVGDELAASLMLTTRGADQLLDFAVRLDRLPCTRVALAAGEIDRAKAYVISDEVS